MIHKAGASNKFLFLLFGWKLCKITKGNRNDYVLLITWTLTAAINCPNKHYLKI
jgi:hypothetical protein